MYIIHALQGAGKCTLRTCLFRCIAPAVCVSYSAEFSGRRVWPGTRDWVKGTGYNRQMPKSSRSTSPRYTAEHASAGLDHNFPEIETWPNQFPGYEIVVDDPEFTSVCPKTGLPDFGNIVIRYVPDRLCLELKSLKEYLQAYRNLGIFQENIVNQVLEDVVRWAKPVWAEVKGEFRPRGGISTVVIAKWPRPKHRKEK
jgi:7-cyano-7-deazaguanine reductase